MKVGQLLQLYHLYLYLQVCVHLSYCGAGALCLPMWGKEGGEKLDDEEEQEQVKTREQRTRRTRRRSRSWRFLKTKTNPEIMIKYLQEMNQLQEFLLTMITDPVSGCATIASCTGSPWTKCGWPRGWLGSLVLDYVTGRKYAKKKGKKKTLTMILGSKI